MTAVEHLAVTHLKNRAAMITTQDIYIQLAKDEMPPTGNISASTELLMHPSNKASFLSVFVCIEDHSSDQATDGQQVRQKHTETEYKI